MTAKLNPVLTQWWGDKGCHLKDANNTLSICAQLENWFGANLPIDHVSTALVHTYVARETGRLAPSTLKRNLGVLKRALQHHRLSGGTVADIEWPKLRVQARSRYLTEKEQAWLVVGANDMVKLLIVLLLDTGMRLGEAEQLTWADIKWPGADTPDLGLPVIDLWRSKTGGQTVLPVSQRLNFLLVDYSNNSRPQFNERGRLWEPYQWGTLVRMVRGVISKLNDANELYKLPEHARHGKVTIHTLRDTFATNMLRRGLPIQDVSYLLGHSNIQQTMKYAHVSPSDVQARARALLDGE